MHRNQSNLSVVNVSVHDLKAHRNNARTHSPRQIRQITDSIEQFGFLNPILTDADHVIVAGHGRVEAAKRLGLSTVPVVQVEHLTKEQIRAYMIADNRLAELAGWDKDLLAIEFQNLMELDTGFDLTVTGFEVPEIDVLIEGLSPTETGQPDPDDAPPDPGPAVTQHGDLWQLGRHRLVCGSALEAESYASVMNGQRARLIWTDPPYNVAIGDIVGLGRIQHREFAMASGEMSTEQFTEFLERALRPMLEHTQPGALAYVCMDWRHLEELLAAARKHGTELKNLCVWAKDTAGMGSLYRSQHELVAVFKHGKAAHRNNVQLGRFGRHRSNVWRYPSPSAFGRKSEEGQLLALHPTVKPVAMVADALLDSSARGDLVLDPFLGSGTTLIAAERVGRCCRGIEIDPAYVDIAIRRWQRHSGDQAIHIESGQAFDMRAATEVAHD